MDWWADLSLNMAETDVFLRCSAVLLATVAALSLNLANNQTVLEHQNTSL